jgi:hypothetical protein
MTIKLPYPHAGQRHVLQHSKRFNWLACGRRWRKTTLLMSVAVQAAARGARILWCAPTFDQVKIGFEEARRACGETGTRFVETPHPEATFAGGGAILYRSFDNPRAFGRRKGFTAAGVVIDEAAEVLADAWYEVLRPTLMDTGGWAWGIGTPKGRNWFWKEHRNEKQRSDTASFNAPTVGARIVVDEQGRRLERVPHPLENPQIEWDEMVNLFETMPEKKFRQEILAEFIEQEGQVFRNVRLCMKGTFAPPRERILYVAGVDLARTTDYTVVVVLEALTRHVVAFDRMTGMSWAAQIERVTNLVRKYNAIAFVDKTGLGDPLFEQLSNTGLTFQPFTFTHDTKRKLVEQLIMAFERQTISLPPEMAVAEDELCAFEASKSATGTTRYSAPEGGHDDCVMALALANYAAHLYGVPTK